MYRKTKENLEGQKQILCLHVYPYIKNRVSIWAFFHVFIEVCTRVERREKIESNVSSKSGVPLHSMVPLNWGKTQLILQINLPPSSSAALDLVFFTAVSFSFSLGRKREICEGVFARQSPSRPWAPGGVQGQSPGGGRGGKILSWLVLSSWLLHLFSRSQSSFLFH